MRGPIDSCGGAHAAAPAGTRRRWPQVAGAVLAFVVAIAAAVGVTARYVMMQDRAAEMAASGFHMSSDTLQEVAPGGAAPSHVAFCDADGTFAVNLYNWEVDNVASVSGVEITYSVTVGNGSLSSVDARGSGSAPEGGPYLLGKDAKGTHVLHVKPGDAAGPVTVTVEATAPYAKTLQASFDVSPLADASASGKLVQSGLTASTGSSDTGVSAVTVQTNQFEGDLVLEWDDGLAPAMGVNEGPGGWTVDYGKREARVAGARELETYRFEFVGAAPGEVTATVGDEAGKATATVHVALAG